MLLETVRASSRLVLVAIIPFVIGACSQKPPVSTPPPPIETALQGAYPLPGSGEQPNPYIYPAPELSTYPLPSQVNPTSRKTPTSIIPFTINTPIPVGATEISGSGVPGIPILIIDITFNGEIFTKGVIGQDGKFSFKLPEPITKGHRVGLMIGDLTGTGWSEDDFSDPGFFGKGAKLVPLMGFVYDSFMVGDQ